MRSTAPPPGALAAWTLPPCASAAWRTIASPRPGARAAARRGSAVEAVEHERQVLVGDPGAVVADDQLAVAQRHLDRAAAVLGGVVEQVRDGPVEPPADPLDQHRFEARREAHAGRVARGPLHRGGDELVERQHLELGHRLLLAREVDEVGDEQGQLLELGDDVGPQPLAVVRVQPAAAEHLEVRAQRGQRRAQLVRGVGHEPPLRALGRRQRLEHRVEGAGEPRELVVAVALDPARQVARARDVLGGVGQLRHRLHGRAGREPREPERRGDAEQRDRRRARSAASRACRRPRRASARPGAPRRPAPAPCRRAGGGRRARRRRRTARARRPRPA